MIVKKRRNRKNCVHFKVNTGDRWIEGYCRARLSTHYCKGVSCPLYKEKQQ